MNSEDFIEIGEWCEDVSLIYEIDYNEACVDLLIKTWDGEKTFVYVGNHLQIMDDTGGFYTEDDIEAFILIPQYGTGDE